MSVSSSRVRRSVCTVALGCLLALVVAHGIHDAAHEDEGGAIVCVALTLGLVAVRFTPSPLTEPFVVIAVSPVPIASRPPQAIDRRPRGSPPAGSLPLRL